MQCGFSYNSELVGNSNRIPVQAFAIRSIMSQHSYYAESILKLVLHVIYVTGCLLTVTLADYDETSAFARIKDTSKVYSFSQAPP